MKSYLRSTSRAARFCRVLALGCAFLAVGISVGSIHPSTATAKAPAGTAATGPGNAKRVGGVAVVRSDNTNSYLRAAAFDQPFSLRLPEQSTCPGDSSHDDWRVQTFIVPADQDPGVLAYNEVSPIVIGQPNALVSPLFDGTGSPFVNQLLGANTEPGQPGHILGFPVMSFARLADSFGAGRYRIGVSCTRFRAGERYWDTTIDIAGSGAARTWKVVGSMPSISGAGGRHTGSLRWIGIALAAVGLFALGVLWGGWRRKSSATRTGAN